jgi:hypothetical protein
MTKFCMAALECAQSYLAGQGHSQLLGWSEDDFAEQTNDMSRPNVRHCIRGGEPFNKAANSESERVTTATGHPASEKE